MRFGLKIFLGIFFILGIGGYSFVASFMQELRPQFRKSTEESLSDVANLLAEIVANEFNKNQIQNGSFSKSFQHFQQRDFNAKIWSLTKHEARLHVYITNDKGIVIYDSLNKDVGKDFSLWRDVHRTLCGIYGARSTLEAEYSDNEIMHVAAPIYNQEHFIAGVLTVRKDDVSVDPFLDAAQKKLFEKSLILFLVAICSGWLLSYGLSKSITKLANYANAVKNGDNKQLPKVSGLELRQLAEAMSSMKIELEGKKYVEQYIHSLTHQLKTPISSIHGAASLLTEKSMPEAHRDRFVTNILTESLRLEDLVQRMLNLANMENRHQLKDVRQIALKSLFPPILETLKNAYDAKHIKILLDIPEDIKIEGELFLLTQALSNLLDNAIGFSPMNASVHILATENNNYVNIEIIDEGKGIPDYALEKLFERFYSLPKQGTKMKGSGLGLCFVKEIARLHGGNIVLSNLSPTGVKACLTLHKKHTKPS